MPLFSISYRFSIHCYGINTVNHTSDPMDDEGHGTHVAGIIGAVGNNGIGVTGVNWNVQLLSCKFIDPQGYGATSAAIECLNYVAKLKSLGINIVATNNSWGGADYSQALADAIQAQEDAGILFIAAAGNSFQNNDTIPTYPASIALPNVISVAATTRLDTLASFSDFGKFSVDLGAPGEEILGTLPGATYGYDTGTSMATPFVTGVAALLKAQDPSRDWKTIRNLILAGGDVDTQAQATVTGRRLNAYGSMTCSGNTVAARTQPVGSAVSATVNSPVTFTVTNIQCGVPAGAVTANVAGTVVDLKDDGVAPDKVAGDGIYTGQWTPAATGSYDVALSTGDNFTINVLTSYQFSGVTPGYVNISGTSLDLSDDSVAKLATPFPITFGQATFQNLYVSSDGTISFTNAFGDFYNRPLPLLDRVRKTMRWRR